MAAKYSVSSLTVSVLARMVIRPSVCCGGGEGRGRWDDHAGRTRRSDASGQALRRRTPPRLAGAPASTTSAQRTGSPARVSSHPCPPCGHEARHLLLSLTKCHNTGYCQVREWWFQRRDRRTAMPRPIRVGHIGAGAQGSARSPPRSALRLKTKQGGRIRGSPTPCRRGPRSIDGPTRPGERKAVTTSPAGRRSVRAEPGLLVPRYAPAVHRRHEGAGCLGEDAEHRQSVDR